MIITLLCSFLTVLAPLTVQSTNCAPGTFVTTEQTRSVCAPCPPDTFSHRFNSASCRRCSANSVPDEAQTTCFCNPGFFFNLSTLACSPCPSGTFREGFNTAFETSCRQCAPNSVPDDKRSACLCNPGFFFNAQLGCSPCPPGTRRAGININFARSCSPCGGLEFQPQPASTSCILCGENGFSNPDRTSCFFCGPGETLIDGVCGICPPGSTTNLTFFVAAPSLLRQGTCKFCQRGWFKPEAGQQACDRCPDGFTSENGATECFPE